MEPCLDWILEAWPRAPAAALLAFSAFLADSEAAFFSLPSLMAAWRAAERAGFLDQHRAGFNLAFSLDRNEYQGETYLELTVADFKSLDGVE